MSEAQVRAEIIHMFQHDMGTFESDEDIVAGVTASNIEDYFNDGLCDVANYRITLA